MTIEGMILKSVNKITWVTPETVALAIKYKLGKTYKVGTIERAGRRLVEKGRLERALFDTIDGRTKFVKWRKGKKV